MIALDAGLDSIGMDHVSLTMASTEVKLKYLTERKTDFPR